RRVADCARHLPRGARHRRQLAGRARGRRPSQPHGARRRVRAATVGGIRSAFLGGFRRRAARVRSRTRAQARVARGDRRHRASRGGREARGDQVGRGACARVRAARAVGSSDRSVPQRALRRRHAVVRAGGPRTSATARGPRREARESHRQSHALVRRPGARRRARVARDGRRRNRQGAASRVANSEARRARRAGVEAPPGPARVRSADDRHAVSRRHARSVRREGPRAAPRHVHGHRQPRRLSRRASDVHGAARPKLAADPCSLRPAHLEHQESRVAQAAGESGRKSIVTVEERGRRHEFGIADLPVTLGASHDADVALEGVAGSIQIGRFKDVFFVQPGRGARSVRVEWIVTAGDTAPPDLEPVVRDRSRASDVAITPIAFKPGAAAKVAVRSGPSRMTIALGTGAGVLAIIAWFAFTAKSVALDIQPTPATVRLPSTLFKLKINDRFLLRPGSHRVAAELPGYYPLDTKIDVGSLADQTIALTLTKLPGLVTLTTEPEIGAEVLVDGVSIGKTPLVDAEITPGMHQLELSAERYLAAARELDVAGANERQALAVTLTPDWAIVSLNTAPAGATVLVDGAQAGVTPAAVEIMSGEHD